MTIYLFQGYLHAVQERVSYLKQDRVSIFLFMKFSFSDFLGGGKCSLEKEKNKQIEKHVWQDFEMFFV